MNHPSDDPETCCPSCNGHGVTAPSNVAALRAAYLARHKPEPKAACEHGQHWLLCEHCGESARNEISESMARWRTDARALWAVRVLDRWAERNEDDALCATKQSQWGNEYWECSDHKQLHHAATPDAARIAAAEALVAEDPSLGEGL